MRAPPLRQHRLISLAHPHGDTPDVEFFEPRRRFYSGGEGVKLQGLLPLFPQCRFQFPPDPLGLTGAFRPEQQEQVRLSDFIVEMRLPLLSQVEVVADLEYIDAGAYLDGVGVSSVSLLLISARGPASLSLISDGAVETIFTRKSRCSITELNSRGLAPRALACR